VGDHNICRAGAGIEPASPRYGGDVTDNTNPFESFHMTRLLLDIYSMRLQPPKNLKLVKYIYILASK